MPESWIYPSFPMAIVCCEKTNENISAKQISECFIWVTNLGKIHGDVLPNCIANCFLPRPRSSSSNRINPCLDRPMKSIIFFNCDLPSNNTTQNQLPKHSCSPNQLISDNVAVYLWFLTTDSKCVWKGYQHHGFDAFFFFLPIWNVALWSSQWVPQLNLKQLQGWFGAVSRWFSGFFPVNIQQ